MSCYDEIDPLIQGLENIETIHELAKSLRCNLLSLGSRKEDCSKYFTWENLIRLAYRWIVENISYELKPQRTLDQVLKDKKASCGGYSRLFEKLCLEIGIPKDKVRLIPGQSKRLKRKLPKKFKVNHSWNAVKIKDSWKLIDCTWGSGFVYNDTFVKSSNEDWFCGDPVYWILDHFPSESEWQLLSTPLEWDEWMKLPIVMPVFIQHNIYFLVPETNLIPLITNDGIVRIMLEVPENVLLFVNLFQNEKVINNRVQILGDTKVVQGRRNVKIIIYLPKDENRIYSISIFSKSLADNKEPKLACKFVMEYQAQNKIEN